MASPEAERKKQERERKKREREAEREARKRERERKKREREAFTMILPMMMDFVSVLLVAITPALNTFKMF